MITSRPDLRIREQTDTSSPKVIEGCFIRFNEPTELWTDYFEEIAPEAVTSSLSHDIKCLFNHERGSVLGSSGNKTLELWVDSMGLWGRVEINENDTEALNVYARVERGDINTCSFGFWPTKEEIDYRDDGTTHFRILDMDLSEISIVAFPAYENTNVEARQKQVAKMRDEDFNTKRKALLKKYGTGE